MGAQSNNEFFEGMNEIRQMAAPLLSLIREMNQNRRFSRINNAKQIKEKLEDIKDTEGVAKMADTLREAVAQESAIAVRRAQTVGIAEPEAGEELESMVNGLKQSLDQTADQIEFYEAQGYDASELIEQASNDFAAMSELSEAMDEAIESQDFTNLREDAKDIVKGTSIDTEIFDKPVNQKFNEAKEGAKKAAEKTSSKAAEKVTEKTAGKTLEKVAERVL